jgi:hypothetical protein
VSHPASYFLISWLMPRWYNNGKGGGKQGTSLIKNLKKYLTNLMLRTLGVRTFSNVETENSVTKCLPAQSLKTSGQAAINLNTSCFQQKNLLAAKDVDSSPGGW